MALGTLVSTVGMLFQVYDTSATAYVTVTGTYDLTLPEPEASDIDTTAYTDDTRTYITGIKEPGVANASYNYIAQDTAQEIIRTATTASPQTSLDWRCIYPDGTNGTANSASSTIVAFSGIPKKVSNPTPLDDRISQTVDIRVSGTVSFTPAT